MVLVSEELHAAAVIAALSGEGAVAYDLDDLAKMATLPANYVEVTVSRRAGAPLRNPGSTGRTGWRVTTRVVCATVTNAREYRRRVEAALNFRRLTVGGSVSTPVQFETEETIGADDGVWSGLTVWTYAL